jgi:hypothetical protein
MEVLFDFGWLTSHVKSGRKITLFLSTAFQNYMIETENMSSKGNCTTESEISIITSSLHIFTSLWCKKKQICHVGHGYCARSLGVRDQGLDIEL